MKTKFYLNGKKTTRKALFTVCGPLWRVLRVGGWALPLRHHRGQLWPAAGGGVAVSCSVFKVRM